MSLRVLRDIKCVITKPGKKRYKEESSMREGWKKVVSAMLCAAMVVSMSGLAVSADGENNDLTGNNLTKGEEGSDDLTNGEEGGNGPAGNDGDGDDLTDNEEGGNGPSGNDGDGNNLTNNEEGSNGGEDGSEGKTPNNLPPTRPNRIMPLSGSEVNDADTLQQAIEGAKDGDTIILADNVTIEGSFKITQRVNLQGTNTTIKGQVVYQLEKPTGNLFVTGITFSNANGVQALQFRGNEPNEGGNLNIEVKDCQFIGGSFGITVNSHANGYYLQVDSCSFSDLDTAISVNVDTKTEKQEANNTLTLGSNVATTNVTHAVEIFNNQPDAASTKKQYKTAENYQKGEAEGPTTGASTVTVTTEDDLLSALSDSKITTIVLGGNISVDKMINISREGVTLDLNGKTITSSENFDNKNQNTSHVINVAADNVTVKNGTIKATNKNRNTLQAYQANGVVFENLVVDHSAAGAGAPIIVNGSTVTMKGKNSLILNELSWGGINVDPNGEEEATLTFENGSLSFSGATTQPVVWIETGEEKNSIVSGFENVGLILSPDGTYIMNPNRPTPPTPDTNSPSGNHSTGNSSSSSSSSSNSGSHSLTPEQSKQQAIDAMWKRAINKINAAKEGSRLKIYMGINEEIPDYVLAALRENNVTVTFYNQDGEEVTIPAGMAPRSLRSSWTLKQLGNYVLGLDAQGTETEEAEQATQESQPAAEQATAGAETGKPNPETGDASAAMMAIAAAAASLCGVVLLSNKKK